MKLLVANWKMYVPKEGVDAFIDALPRDGREGPALGIAPPFPYVPQVRRAADRARGILVGGQNCSDQREGALTGEVAPGMLLDCGAEFVIVGHSERRTLFAESDALVGRKVAAAIEAGIRPLLCIGEDLATRENGGTMALLSRQLDAVFQALPSMPRELWIAYEPVWAIGTGRNATPSMAAEAHHAVRRLVTDTSRGGTEATILYGGSVKPANAGELAAEREIDGFLVGGASLESASFLEIAKALA
ncbi:MAG: triose-phosphate isomerase [Thermoanaerobaculia bacterium]